VAVIVLGIATAINPPGVTIVILALMSKGGMRKAVAFVVGNTIAILVASAVGLMLAYAAIQASSSSSHPAAAKYVGLGELAIGLAMLGIGVWSLTGGKGNTNSLVERAMGDIDSVRPWFLFGLGLMLVSYTMPLLLMGELATVSLPEQLAYVILYIVYLVLALITVLLPIIVYVFRPESSAKYLEQARVWLAAHGGAALATVFIVLGVAFAVRGASQYF
jgi:hypothetical protein